MTSFSFGRRAAREVRPARAPDDAAVAPGGDAAPGPGWYQSSWELRCGLLVREAPAPDAALHQWLLQPERPPPKADDQG